jgi:hypothetical protein
MTDMESESESTEYVSRGSPGITGRLISSHVIDVDTVEDVDVRQVASPRVKVTFNLLRTEVEELRELARKHGRTATDTVRRAIAMEQYIDRVISEGSRLLVQTKDGKVREIVPR